MHSCRVILSESSFTSHAQRMEAGCFIQFGNGRFGALHCPRVRHYRRRVASHNRSCQSFDRAAADNVVNRRSGQWCKGAQCVLLGHAREQHQLFSGIQERGDVVAGHHGRSVIHMPGLGLDMQDVAAKRGRNFFRPAYGLRVPAHRESSASEGGRALARVTNGLERVNASAGDSQGAQRRQHLGPVTAAGMKCHA